MSNIKNLNNNFLFKSGRLGSKLLFGVVVAVMVLTPLSAQAAGSSALVPCGRQGQPDCQLCDIFKLLQNVINFAVKIVIALGVVLFIYAGFLILFAAQNPSNVDKGFGVMKTTTIGFLLLFGAWTLTNIILQLLAGNNGAVFAGWNEIICTNPPQETTQPNPGGTGGNGGPIIPTPQETFSGGGGGSGGGGASGGWDQIIGGSGDRIYGGTGSNIVDSEIRNELSRAGINPNALTNCLVNNQVSCGYYGGIKESIVADVISLKKRCPNCEMVARDGTGPGHGTRPNGHSRGLKMDLSPSDSLNNYVTSNFEPMAVRGDGAQQWRDPVTKAVWALETFTEAGKTHWDVTTIH